MLSGLIYFLTHTTKSLRCGKMVVYLCRHWVMLGDASGFNRGRLNEAVTTATNPSSSSPRERKRERANRQRREAAASERRKLKDSERVRRRETTEKQKMETKRHWRREMV